MSDDASLITSSSNPLVTRIRKLTTKKGRAQSGQTFVEGIAVVRQAIDAGIRVDTIVVAPELLKSADAFAEVDRASASGVPVKRLDAALFQRLSDRDHPAGLAAIVSPRLASENDLLVERDALVVALDGVSGPGNLGSVARTADAVGASGLILTGEATDPWDPAALKASMGTLFELPVCVLPTARDAIEWARTRNLTAVATSARAERSLYDSKTSPPALLMFGSERHGLTEDTLEAADERLRIPIQGHASSLNLAVAAGIFLVELSRRS